MIDQPSTGDDCETTIAIYDHLTDHLAIMPRRFRRLRLDQDHSDALVMHWTGNVGKRRIGNFYRNGLSQAPNILDPSRAAYGP